MDKDNKIPLLVISGPTAAGKSYHALRIAEKFSGEIISADSAQVYRYLDIGTAKPKKEERERVKHHLIDMIDPDNQFTAADYQQEARAAIKEINREGRLPIVCGGTGLYIKSLIENYTFSKEGRDVKLREDLKNIAETEGSKKLHNKLAEVDKFSAEKIHPNDIVRIIRALEVYYKEGKPLSEINRAIIKESYDYNLLFIGLTMRRELLYKRINDRTNKMFSEGLLEEVKELLKKYDSNAPGLQILGYRQCVDYLKNKISHEELLEKIKTETRNYAKRQYTWFRREENIFWIDCETEKMTTGKNKDDNHIIEIISGLLKEKKLVRRIY